VFEVLADRSLQVAQVFVDRAIDRGVIQKLRESARARSVPVRMVSRDVVTRMSHNGRQHQGMAADVLAPQMSSISSWLESSGPETTCLLLDGVTVPANVGMIVRAATASGIGGIIVPTAGVADIGPLVVKASAGTAFRAPLVRARTAREAAELTSGSGFELVSVEARGGEPLWTARMGPRTVFVIGGESAGVSPEVRQLVRAQITIPMGAGVESLNVASAASVLCFELARRRRPAGEPRAQ
jgi:23S rRNA (guanosine2251-2'-O)-methyltransferase